MQSGKYFVQSKFLYVFLCSVAIKSIKIYIIISIEMILQFFNLKMQKLNGPHNSLTNQISYIHFLKIRCQL